jgi:plastocyanin domain-containing protein
MTVTAVEWAVVVVGLAAIGWVNWYFFAARRPVAAALGIGPKDIRIDVRGGYDPGVIRVVPGRPVRLTFLRRESNPCSEEIVLPAFGIRRVLPEGKPVTVEFTPTVPGRYEFTCGMGMLHGTLEVQESR